MNPFILVIQATFEFLNSISPCAGNSQLNCSIHRNGFASNLYPNHSVDCSVHQCFVFCTSIMLTKLYLKLVGQNNLPHYLVIKMNFLFMVNGAGKTGHN